MPQNVYTTRFLGDYIAGSGSVAFECPEGFVMVVRDIDVFETNPGGAIAEYSANFGVVFWSTGPNLTTTYNHDQWQGRIVITAGEQLTVITDLPLNVHAAGYLLSLP